ncbi:hypothetical protein NQ318_019452 [Aromia moschata]|uniref:NADP-dependent oxidoreductase domain-containing protein n=1 Tax=Aromia moschata TaxID=1265417 RepID=A0AAV8XAD9_9CUCU|nr:hypothetical protein NQ318_019452 [Aromia moschata]
MACNVHFDLSSGFKIPALGYGTWLAHFNQLHRVVHLRTMKRNLKKALEAALEAGYRHIDAAIVYLNEHIIGRVLKKWFSSGKLSREDIFLTTKLPPTGNRPEGVKKYLRKSLDDLQVDYVDLYLVHVPFGLNDVEGDLQPKKPDGTADVDLSTDHIAVWKAMEEAVDSGLTKSIGVSNFNSDQIGRILKNCRIPPCNLQIEHHAYLQQPKLVEFCKQNKIVVTAYSPLGSPGLSKLGKTYSPLGSPGLSKLGKETPDLLGHPMVKEIAQKYNKTTAQVLLRHIVQKGISVTPQRIRQNIDIFDFQLSASDLNILNGLDANLRILDFEFIFKGIKDHPEYPFKENL